MTSRRSAPLFAAIASVCLAASGSAHATDAAAHALAQKFAAGAEQEDAARKAAKAKQKAAEEAKRRAAEESEMLERARVEAAERKTAADKARAEAEAADARREEEERAEKARRLAEEQRAAREKFIADQLRAEEERVASEKRKEESEKRAEEERVAEEKHRAEEERVASEKRKEESEKRAEEERLAAQKRDEEERRIADENQRRLVAEREAEHRNLTEKLMRLDRERTAKALEDKTREDKELAEKHGLDDTPRMSLGVPPHQEPATNPDAAMPTSTARAPAPPTSASAFAAAPPLTRVTVLLVMQSGTNGIRRYGRKTADPVLCTGARCWAGTGADRIAIAMTRGQALGPANTLGRRAAACNQHLGCVFRDVDFRAASAVVQPIDLRILRHDRREPLSLEADRSCRVTNGALLCDKTFSSRTWRAWVVPEDVATRAGAAALEAALARGLAVERSAALTPAE